MNDINKKVIQFIKCLCTTFMFENYCKYFGYFNQNKKLKNVMYSKIIEFINDKDVYKTFDVISKLYKQDENLLDKYKKIIEPYVKKDIDANPK